MADQELKRMPAGFLRALVVDLRAQLAVARIERNEQAQQRADLRERLNAALTRAETAETRHREWLDKAGRSSMSTGAEVDWVKLVDPTPEQLERHGPGIWTECKRCGGRDLVRCPADVSDVVRGINLVLAAHADCVNWPALPREARIDYFCPTCGRHRALLEPCDHIAISVEALQVLRAKLGAPDATGREATDRKIDGEQGRVG